MGIGRPVKPLILSAEDREKLRIIARRPKTSQQQALRARIILNCARSLSNAEVAQKLEVSRKKCVASIGGIPEARVFGAIHYRCMQFPP
jgi:hypothetical protein